MKAKKSTSTWSAVTRDQRRKTSNGSRRDPLLTKRASAPPVGGFFLSPGAEGSPAPGTLPKPEPRKRGTTSEGAGPPPGPPPEPVRSLYVHVPFCAQKCEYCAFYSEASSGELVNRYVSALIRELELVA